MVPHDSRKSAMFHEALRHESYNLACEYAIFAERHLWAFSLKILDFSQHIQDVSVGSISIFMGQKYRILKIRLMIDTTTISDDYQ